MDLRTWWYKVLRLEHLEVKTLQEDSYGFNSLSFTIHLHHGEGMSLCLAIKVKSVNVRHA